jgi:multidrug efflux pump subunit AcrB
MLCTAFAGCRAKGVAITHAIMLASQRQGAMVTAGSLVFAVMWGAWLLRHLPSLSQFAAIALFATVVSWVVSLTLLPAALSVLAARRPAEETNWLDEALGSNASFHRRNACDALAMIVLAAAIFCAAFLPAVRFGERQLPSTPPPLLETPDARGAVHILTPQDALDTLVEKLSGLPEVGTIRTVTQFLPPEAPEKIAELRRLSGLTTFEPAFRGPADQAQLTQSFAELEQQLTAIAVGPATSPDLKDAALRLRRSLMLFMSPTPPSPERVAQLEAALFGGLGQLSGRVERLSQLAVPTVESLDPRLLRRFVSEQGIWRIEVMPRSGTSELNFSAAIRRAVPQAAGEPLVSLARNEIIHHETVRALAPALAFTAFLVLVALRNVTAWILTMVPAAAFITLAAAVSVTFRISINASMLAGLSAAIAVLIVCSMRVAGQLSDNTNSTGAFGLALRAALLPPLALAGAVAPLALSSRPSVSEVGGALAVLLLIAAALSVLLVPTLARWIDTMMGRSHRFLYRR